MNKMKEPLFRKVNTRARNVHHDFGGDYRHDRNTKAEQNQIDTENTRSTMHGSKKRGLDYTPLYRFLLSKVGQDWDKVHSEAVLRLDKPDAIYHLVARNESEQEDYVRCGENSHYSGLYIDADNKLQKVNPNLGPQDIIVCCKCCTHTFNGELVTSKPRQWSSPDAPFIE